MPTITTAAAALVKGQAAFAAELALILSGRSTLRPEAGDRRFQDPTWSDNGLYRKGLQTYLAWRRGVLQVIDDVGLDPDDAARARFAASLVTEALAPTNFLLGNPAALRKAVETRGASLVRGFRNFVSDVLTNGGMPSQVNRDAFRIGKDLAVTPGSVVLRNDVLELIQYAPVGDKVYSRPLLLVPPQINKFYVMDLAPGRSLTEYAVANGIPFFTVSWRNPTAAHRNWGLDTYLEALLQAVDAVCEITGSKDINTLGVCAGGITLSLLLAHMAARGDRRVRSMTLLVTLLDTGAQGVTGLFATERAIALSKRYSRARGVLRGEEMGRLFAWLRPNDLVWSYWVNNYLLGNEPPPFDILRWNNDSTRLPARLHGEFLDILVTNPFKNPRSLTLLGTPIDVSAVKCESYIIGGTTDHITPWQTCYASTRLLGGKPQFVLSSSGHIQSIINPPGGSRSSFMTSNDSPADPNEWLAGAEQHPGSWWGHWMAWLAARSGRRRVARPPGSARYRPVDDAPGAYVHG